MGSRQLNIRLSDEMADRLEQLAAVTGRTKTHYVTEFVERGINDLSDHYILRDALDEFLDSDDEAVDVDSVDWAALGQ